MHRRRDGPRAPVLRRRPDDEERTWECDKCNSLHATEDKGAKAPDANAASAAGERGNFTRVGVINNK